MAASSRLKHRHSAASFNRGAQCVAWRQCIVAHRKQQRRRRRARISPSAPIWRSVDCVAAYDRYHRRGGVVIAGGSRRREARLQRDNNEITPPRYAAMCSSRRELRCGAVALAWGRVCIAVSNGQKLNVGIAHRGVVSLGGVMASAPSCGMVAPRKRSLSRHAASIEHVEAIAIFWREKKSPPA